MKQIILKYFNGYAETEYAIFDKLFSFDYTVRSGITFITFFDENHNTVLWADTSHDITPAVDFEIINDDIYCTEMEDIIIDTVQEIIEDYLTNEEAVLDINIVMDEVSNRLTDHYKNFFEKRHNNAEV